MKAEHRAGSPLISSFEFVNELTRGDGTLPTATTRSKKNTALNLVLNLVFELSLDKWKLAFATGLGDRILPRPPLLS
jgi:hypothetical protein